MILKGNLLVADPKMFQDYNFRRSVIVLVDHNNDGTVGFVLNKQHEFSSQDILPEINCNLPIYRGGPVDTESLYFIHNQPKKIPNSLKIKDNLFWGGDFSVVIKLINSKLIDSHQIKFFLGYSGWAYQQLDCELDESSWVLVNKKLETNDIFTNPENIWRDKIFELGGKYLMWLNAPENPNHN